MLDKLGEYARAEEAYQQAIDSQHAEWAPRAAFNLGMLFENREEYARAEEAYQQAIDSEDLDAASKARLNVGVLFENRGEYARAEEAYQQAINSRHPEVAPKGTRNLRGLTMRLTARESGGARKTRGGTRSGSAKTLAQHHRFRVWSTVKTCFPTLGHIASYKILEQ